MKKLSPNLNCIVTCENKDEKIEFGHIFGQDYNKCSTLPSTYHSFRITNSTHEYCNYDTESSYKTSKWKHYEFLTFKEFKEKYLNMQKEFILPKTWYVVVTKENKDIVSKWRFGNESSKLSVGQVAGMYEWNSNKISKEHNDITSDNTRFNQEITFEEFKNYVLKEKEMNKEIIGYKTPYDLWEGDVKKGEVYVKSPLDKNYGLSTKIQDDCFYIPKEVVETWEAVYKQQEYKGIVKGSNKNMSYVIKKQGLVHCDDKLIAIIDLKKFLAAQDSNLLPWRSMGTSWSIGCLEGVTREELQDIINQHNKLFNL